MKYLMNAIINFEVEADSRAEAHIEAANRLIESDLSGFDLAKLTVSGSIDAGAARPPASDIRLQSTARPLLAGTEIGRFTADRDGWYDIGTNPPRYLGPIMDPPTTTSARTLATNSVAPGTYASPDGPIAVTPATGDGFVPGTYADGEKY